jgi:hypothetical protein
MRCWSRCWSRCSCRCSCRVRAAVGLSVFFDILPQRASTFALFLSLELTFDLSSSRDAYSTEPYSNIDGFDRYSRNRKRVSFWRRSSDNNLRIFTFPPTSYVVEGLSGVVSSPSDS